MIFDTLKNIENYAGLGRVYDGLQLLAKTDFSALEAGKYTVDGDNLFYIVQTYETKAETTLPEAHKAYIDVQFVVEGEEDIGFAQLTDKTPEIPTDAQGDVKFYDSPVQLCRLRAGDFAVFYPNDLHAPCRAVTAPAFCKKVVVKVKI